MSVLHRFAIWLRRKRRDQAYRFGKKAFEDGLPPRLMALGIWPKADQADLRDAFIRGWVHRSAIQPARDDW